MPRFRRSRNVLPRLTRGVYTLQKGIGFLQAGDYGAALREFRRVAASKNPRTPRLIKGVAGFYIYNTERARKESKKIQYGNSNLISFTDTNKGTAWSDVDIAAVLVAPNNRFTTQFLASFLGRSEEAIRFQRRYVFSRPLRSWRTENGKHYTRFTQNQRVAAQLGLS